MIADLIRAYPEGRRHGVTDLVLDKASERLGFDIPGEVGAFYRETNGLIVHERRLLLHDLETAVKYARAIAGCDFVDYLGLLPLTESNDSNPYCVACKPPVEDRIIHIRHDDAPRLAFRNVDQFAANVLDLASRTKWIIDDLSLGYTVDHSNRTIEDDAAAEAIVAFVQSGKDQDDHLLLLALALYSKNRSGQIVPYLEHESMWVREDAAIHLGNIGDLLAIEPLRILAESQPQRQDGRAAQLALKKLNRIKHGGAESAGPAAR